MHFLDKFSNSQSPLFKDFQLLQKAIHVTANHKSVAVWSNAVSMELEIKMNSLPAYFCRWWDCSKFNGTSAKSETLERYQIVHWHLTLGEDMQVFSLEVTSDSSDLLTLYCHLQYSSNICKIQIKQQKKECSTIKFCYSTVEFYPRWNQTLNIQCIQNLIRSIN